MLPIAVGFVAALFFPGLLVSSPVLATLESSPFYVVHILINAQGSNWCEALLIFIYSFSNFKRLD